MPTRDADLEILLIEPPYYRLMGERRFWVPLGLLGLARVLRSHGLSTYVYNADATVVPRNGQRVLTYSEKFYDSDVLGNDNTDRINMVVDEFTRVLREYRPAVVGISVKSDAVPVAIMTIDLVRRELPQARIMLGGPHFSAQIDPVLAKRADAICVGEGEAVVADLARILLDAPLGPEPIIQSGAQHEPFDVNESATIDFDCLVDHQATAHHSLSKLMIASSRGCPFTCAFCSMGTKNRSVRYMDGGRVGDMMKELRERLGVTKYYFVDDTFGLSNRQLDEFGESLGELRGTFRWSCMSHANVLTRQRVERLRGLGCDAIHLGVESGSQRMLDLLDKRVKVERLIQCADDIHHEGVDLRAFVMVGIPGETPRDLCDTRNLIERMQPSEVAAQVYVPYQGTALFNRLRGDGLIAPLDWTQFIKSHLHYGRQKPEKNSDASIRGFLEFADEWNSIHM